MSVVRRTDSCGDNQSVEDNTLPLVGQSVRFRILGIISVLIVCGLIISVVFTTRNNLNWSKLWRKYSLTDKAQHSVLLKWSASSSPGVTGYNVYRSGISGSGYIRLNSQSVKDLSYLDSSVSSGQSYYYVTTAVDANGNESKYSTELAIKIP